GADGAPGREKSVPDARQTMFINNTRYPHGGIHSGVGGVDRRGWQPPGKAPASQEKIRFRSFAKLEEKNSTAYHENQKKKYPDPV
ncbi:MAG: hypothetical protein JSU61_07480, partial [Fidelibacterota bacterium]